MQYARSPRWNIKQLLEIRIMSTTGTYGKIVMLIKKENIKLQTNAKMI